MKRKYDEHETARAGQNKEKAKKEKRRKDRKRKAPEKAKTRGEGRALRAKPNRHVAGSGRQSGTREGGQRRRKSQQGDNKQRE